MGLKPGTLPENILKRMPKEDRAPMGKAGRTNAEAQAVADLRTERALQGDMENLCRQRGLFFIRSRMDKRTTVRNGLPDFIIILRGEKTLAVEAKVAGGELSDDQRRVFTQYWEQTGGVVHIIWNLDQFRELLDTALA